LGFHGGVGSYVVLLSVTSCNTGGIHQSFGGT